MKYRKIGPFRDILVWQKSMDLLVSAYKLTDTFPKTEMFGLTSQIRRSSLSIPSNIAEGSLRGSNKEFLRFLFIAYGSGAEVQTQLEAGRLLGFINKNDFDKTYNLSDEVMKMLNVLIKKLKSNV